MSESGDDREGVAEIVRTTATDDDAATGEGMTGRDWAMVAKELQAFSDR